MVSQVGLSTLSTLRSAPLKKIALVGVAKLHSEWRDAGRIGCGFMAILEIDIFLILYTSFCLVRGSSNGHDNGIVAQSTSKLNTF